MSGTKAIILAAGKGERLNTITRAIPKPMIEITGKPLLLHNIELCRKHNITDIYINVHHLHEKITRYFGNGQQFGVRITYSYEEELLGTSGAVRKIATDYWEDRLTSGQHPTADRQKFLVVYGDNFSDYDIGRLEQTSDETGALAVVAFHYRQETSNSGVAEFDQNLRIARFIEKPKTGESASRWVNAGIYLFRPAILEYIPKGFSDFGRDIFPALLKAQIPIYGVCEEAEVRAFDTMEMYKESIGAISENG